MLALPQFTRQDETGITDCFQRKKTNTAEMRNTYTAQVQVLYPLRAVLVGTGFAFLLVLGPTSSLDLFFCCKEKGDTSRDKPQKIMGLFGSGKPKPSFGVSLDTPVVNSGDT